MRRPHSNHFDRTSETTKGISNTCFSRAVNPEKRNLKPRFSRPCGGGALPRQDGAVRSEEHTSELQSQFHLVCRLLLEKKKKIIICVFSYSQKTKCIQLITRSVKL